MFAWIALVLIDIYNLAFNSRVPDIMNVINPSHPYIKGWHDEGKAGKQSGDLLNMINVDKFRESFASYRPDYSLSLIHISEPTRPY
jgi:hypothetical protein